MHQHLCARQQSPTLAATLTPGDDGLLLTVNRCLYPRAELDAPDFSGTGGVLF